MVWLSPASGVCGVDGECRPQMFYNNRLLCGAWNGAAQRETARGREQKEPLASCSWGARFGPARWKKIRAKNLLALHFLGFNEWFEDCEWSNATYACHELPIFSAVGIVLGDALEYA